MYRRIVVMFFVAVSLATVISPALRAGVPGKKAVYRGGTLAQPKPATKGTVTITEPSEFVFRFAEGELRVPYDRVNSIEYGQKAGRRLGLAIMINPAFLLSKKRRHYLTISFLDPQDGQQIVVFELGKKIVRITLAGLQARTGLKIEYEDEEARKSSQR